MQPASELQPKDQKQLLITFDYELFLGNRSGFVDDCMISPTKKLISLLDHYGVRSIFFVDTTFLLRLKKQAETSPVCAVDFKKVADQLITLVEKGHYVYPHLHPHWLDATYIAETNQWKLNSTEKYLFKNITPLERDTVFDGSVNLLKEILHPKFPAYKINAFRAGGWSIQPFTNFIPYFKKHQFLYEFSVLGGFYQFTDAQYFDFSNAPLKSIYRFGDDMCVEQQTGPYVQFNISSIEISPSVSWMNKVWLKLHGKITGDHTFNKGEGQPSRVLNNVKPAIPEGKDLSNSHWERVAVELLTSVKLNSYLEFLDLNNYMHFISHPKMITNHNLSVFEKFLKKSFNKYSIVTDFHKMIAQ